MIVRAAFATLNFSISAGVFFRKCFLQVLQQLTLPLDAVAQSPTCAGVLLGRPLRRVP
jgi:hypothetical protein